MVLNPNHSDDAELDIDQDGMTNYQEWFWAQRGLDTDIRDPSDARGDEDEDGIINGLEIQYQMDPLNPDDAERDFDQDGLTNAQEVNVGLNPRDPDDAELDLPLNSSYIERLQGLGVVVRSSSRWLNAVSGRGTSHRRRINQSHHIPQLSPVVQ